MSKSAETKPTEMRPNLPARPASSASNVRCREDRQNLVPSASVAPRSASAPPVKGDLRIHAPACNRKMKENQKIWAEPGDSPLLKAQERAAAPLLKGVRAIRGRDTAPFRTARGRRNGSPSRFLADTAGRPPLDSAKAPVPAPDPIPPWGDLPPWSRVGSKPVRCNHVLKRRGNRPLG